MTVTTLDPTSTQVVRRLRLLPVPPLDGPYDDEPHDPVAPVVEGSLALSFPPPGRATVPLRLVPPAAGDAVPVAPIPRPDPRRWVARLAQALAEVLAGARPPHQLAEVASLEVLHLRRRALAFRVEWVRNQWRCTAVHIG